MINRNYEELKKYGVKYHEEEKVEKFIKSIKDTRYVDRYINLYNYVVLHIDGDFDKINIHPHYLSSESKNKLIEKIKSLQEFSETKSWRRLVRSLENDKNGVFIQWMTQQWDKVTSDGHYLHGKYENKLIEILKELNIHYYFIEYKSDYKIIIFD